MIQSRVVFVLFAVALSCALAFSDDQMEQLESKFKELAADCLKDHPLTADDLKSFEDKKFPEAENAGCFGACIFNKVGVFDDKGTVQHEAALEKAKELFQDEEELNTIKEFITTCASVNDHEVTDGEKGCQRAKLAYECFVEHSAKFGF